MGAIDRIRHAYRPDPPAPHVSDPEAARRTYAHWRVRMFLAFFLGYALLYFGRKNISTALPALSDDLGYSNTELGLIGSSLYVTYGLGKFLNGILADRANVRLFLATGLIVSGLLNLVFGSLSSLWALALVWGCNGWFQSMGFPPIARGMTLWFPSHGKATRWAWWTCSHQAGTAAVMALTAWTLAWGGWRWCFLLPGIICIVAGMAALPAMADTPESKGVPRADAFPGREEGDPADYRATLVRRVLLNRNLWIIGLADLLVYLVRFGTLDWTTKFLKEVKGYDAETAALRASIMPLFGVLGVLVSGWTCDAAFRGRYRVVVATCFACLALSIWGFHDVGPGHPLLDLALMASIGFFVEGPQSILGAVAAVDAGGSARVAAAAAGLVGILSYVGATASGVGTGAAIDSFGWSGAFWLWGGCAAAGFLLCALVWRER